MPIVLDLRHLQMLRAIAETGRVTDAADRLGLTPSALSHRIREAERRLGITLYNRLHKRLRMTPAAEHLSHVADLVLGELERAEADVRRMHKGIHHVVRLGMESYSTYHWLPRFLQWLRSRRSDLEIQVVADTRLDTLVHLSNRRIDIAIIPGEASKAGLVRIPLFEDEVVFIMPPNHHLAGKDHIEPLDLENEAFITYTLIPEPDREFARFMRPAGIYPRWTAPVEVPEAIVDLVAGGFGTSVLARWAVEGAVRAGRVTSARLSETGLPVQWSAVLRNEDAVSSPIRDLADDLAAWCTEDPHGFRPVGS